MEDASLFLYVYHYQLVSKAFGNLPKLRVKGSLEKLLYHSSLDVRESAGEALAFLFEALHEESDQVNGEAAASEVQRKLLISCNMRMTIPILLPFLPFTFPNLISTSVIYPRFCLFILIFY